MTWSIVFWGPHWKRAKGFEDSKRDCLQGDSGHASVPKARLPADSEFLRLSWVPCYPPVLPAQVPP